MNSTLRLSIATMLSLLIFQAPAAPKNPAKIRVIISGIHGVVLKPDTAQRRKLLRKNWWQAISKMNLKMWGASFKKAVSSSIGLVEDPSAEQFLAHAGKNKKLRSLILKMAQAYKPVDGVVNLYKALSNLDVELFIATNTGKSIIEHVSTQDEFKDIFALFDLEKSKATTYQNDKQSIQMPERKFFVNYLNWLNIEFKMNLRPEEVLFIDSNWNNVTAAKNAGWKTIYFDGANKEGKYFRKSLRKLSSDIEKALGTKIAFAQ